MKLGIEQVFVLGQSRIRIRDAAYVVAQEERLPASPPNQATHQRRAWLSNPRSLGFAATALIALEFLGLWLDATSEAQLSTFLAPILTINLIALTWIGFWSLLNRLFAGASRFQSHLRVTLITLLSYSVLDVLASHLGFIFLLPSVGLVMAIIAVLMLAALVYRHLAIIGPEALRFKRAVVLGCLLLVGVGSTVIWYEGRDRRGGADIQVELKPPSWRLRPAMKMEDAMVRLDQLKPELEQARTKPLPRDSVLGGVREDDD